MTIRIRAERPDDVDAIRKVVSDAFESTVEAGLVDAIRADSCYRPGLALVAEDDGGGIVGHVMISHAELHDDDGTVHPVGMLSPLAVAPDRQRQGIGSTLVREAAAKADVAGDQVVVVEGSPRYYARFGFVDCRTLGITIHLPDWAPPNAGQALPLSAWDGSVRGTLVHPPPFEGLE